MPDAAATFFQRERLELLRTVERAQRSCFQRSGRAELCELALKVVRAGSSSTRLAPPVGAVRGVGRSRPVGVGPRNRDVDGVRGARASARRVSGGGG